MNRQRSLWTFLVLLTLIGSATADNSIKFKVRIQPRLDLGDHKGAAGDGYATRLDLYIRRSRLEVSGRPTDDMFYVLGASGDRAGQRGSSAGAELNYAFVNYRLAPSIEVRAGLVKLPYSRSALVSSSRLLLIERTQTVNTAASAFGSYIAPHLALHGRWHTGAIGYSLALMDGLQPGDADRLSGQNVSASGTPGLVGRFEISPDGWVEGGESDSHLGVGRHLTVGVNGALQSGIEFGAATEDRLVIGGDISFHQSGVSFLSEYLRVNRNGADDVAPAGWYTQVGVYIADLKLEPAVRFERYDADLPGGSDVTTAYTGGLNWYRHGHDLKIMANVVHSRFQRAVREQDGAGSRTLLQLQNQMYF